jgi:hypothetical protein
MLAADAAAAQGEAIMKLSEYEIACLITAHADMLVEMTHSMAEQDIPKEALVAVIERIRDLVEMLPDQGENISKPRMQ